jgi:hypothetical protein
MQHVVGPESLEGCSAVAEKCRRLSTFNALLFTVVDANAAPRSGLSTATKGVAAGLGTMVASSVAGYQSEGGQICKGTPMASGDDQHCLSKDIWGQVQAYEKTLQGEQLKLKPASYPGFYTKEADESKEGISTMAM